MLDGNDYKARKFPIKKCATIAKVQGFPAFALENGGQCLGGKDILQTYNMYGASRACQADGRGGPWSMEVYKFTSELFIKIKRILCSDWLPERTGWLHLARWGFP